jgi:hypothetical protein
MSRAHAILKALERCQAERIDGSSRGSGLNAVWKIRVDGRPVILKTYSSRRAPFQSCLNNVGHLLSGRTPYTARARQRTERWNLLLWRQHGFDVPALLPCLPLEKLPIPHLCMEYIEGRTLSAYLADDRIPAAERDETFDRFLATWGSRHSRADRLSEPRLLQEHGTLDHVLVSGRRLATFDLEVSFRGGRRVRSCISGEISGYLRSLLKQQSPETSQRLLAMLVRRYPHRSYLEEVCTELLRNGNPLFRLLHALERRCRGKPGAIHKYNAAAALLRALSDAR